MDLDYFSQLTPTLGGLAVLAAVLQLYSRRTDPASGKQANAAVTSAYISFRALWLVIYFIVMGADWLQGPYVYSLYESLGFSRSEIANLFICGFASSMFFGTFIGSLADKFGRKKFAVLFGVLYSASCLTKLSNKFYVLLFGRFLSGIATSLLFSVFEAWMVAEHFKRGFPPELLSSSFSAACFGNGIVAIVAGLVASYAASMYGFVAPFMISLALLLVSIVLVSALFSENYGNASVQVKETFTNAFHDVQKDTKIPILGLMQSLFEGAMYTFVFMWTPTLNEAVLAGRPDGADGDGELDTERMPYGVIFACFMVAIMIGSTIFEVLVRTIQPERIAVGLFVISGGALLVPALVQDQNIVLGSFLVFELCCGIYFPCLGTLRSKYIPERTRATIMNFFRMGLNILVVIVLLKVASLNNQTIFLICSAWLGLAFLLAQSFVGMVARSAADPLASTTPGQE